jgi:hypothetical protein
MTRRSYFGLAVLRCPETYQYVAANLGYSLFLGKRSRLCEFGKHLRFESRDEAERWVAAFYKRGSNKARYELGVVEVADQPGVGIEYTVKHTTVFSTQVR